MEESDERGGESTPPPPSPFWDADSLHFPPHPRPSFNLLLKPWFIFILAPIICLFLLVAISHFASFLARIVPLKHPSDVKKTWDTLNLLLVAFAILFGILCRSSNTSNGSHHGSSNAEDGVYKTLEKSESSNGEDRQIPRWLDQYGSDPTPLFNRPPPPAAAAATSSADSDSTRAATFGRLRSSISYPDLRKQEACASASDDIDGSSSRRHSDQRHRRRRSYGEKDLGDSGLKTIAVDTFVSKKDHEDSGLKTIPVDTFVLRHPKISYNSSVQQATSTSATRSAEMARWEFQPLPRKEAKRRSKAQEIKKKRQAQQPPPPPPPPPPPRSQTQRSKQQGSGGERSSKGAKDIKSALSFLYHQRKKKQQENHMPSSMPASSPIPSTQPPPPPPPPPAFVFHHIFSHKKRSSSSGTKSGRIHSIPVSPPPPPPPPPSKKLAITRRPPKGDRDEGLGGGSRYPLIPMPPPPPPPPFKMEAMRFAVRGDFVRVQSGLSDSSEASDVIEIPSNEANASSNSSAAVFCPSPDVNTKADTFISRFREGWKLEKMNSLRAKEEEEAAADSAPADQEHQ